MSVKRSINFDLVKGYYNEGKANSLWTKEQVFKAVGKWITAEEYKELTGEEYIAPVKEPTETEQAILNTASNSEITMETQLIIMEAMADQYEESLERELNNMEVQATIYEEILAISERM